MSKQLELLQKLKALAERGVGGEKTNAQQQMERVMKQFGITHADLEGLERRSFNFTVRPEQEWLFLQVAYSVIGVVEGMPGIQAHRLGSYIVITTQADQAVEIEAKFAFYESVYVSELKTFQLAFIQKNTIFPANAPAGDNGMSDEERNKMLKMMGSIEKAEYYKQIKQ